MRKNQGGAVQSPVELFAAKIAKAGWEGSITDRQIVDRLIATLTPQEQQVVGLRIGLGQSHAFTLKAIGDIIGLSDSRISLIEAKAYRKMRWVCKNVGIDDHAALDSLAQQREKTVADEDQARERREIQKALDQATKRQHRLERDERRRANARKNAWERRLRKAEERHQQLNDEAAYLAQRVNALEGRGWLARTIIPRNTEIDRSRARAQQCGIEIAEAAAAIAKLHATRPEGPDIAE